VSKRWVKPGSAPSARPNGSAATSRDGDLAEIAVINSGTDDSPNYRTDVSYFGTTSCEQGRGLICDAHDLALGASRLADHAQSLDHAEQRPGHGVRVEIRPDRSVGLSQPHQVAQQHLDPAQRSADLGGGLRIQGGDLGRAGDDQAAAPAFTVAGGLRIELQ